MGDRLLMQCHDNETPPNFGAVLYCHWSGSEAPAIVAALRERMATRPDDVNYATARLAQAAMGSDDGNTGFGINNAPRLLTADDSHGDAGIVLINVANACSVTCFGGYLKAEDGQFV